MPSCLHGSPEHHGVLSTCNPRMCSAPYSHTTGAPEIAQLNTDACTFLPIRDRTSSFHGRTLLGASWLLQMNMALWCGILCTGGVFRPG